MQLLSFAKSNLLSSALSHSTNFNNSITTLLHSKSLRFSHRATSSSSSSPPHEELKTENKEAELVARRPVMDVTDEDESIRSLTESLRRRNLEEREESYSAKIDEKMSEIAKKLPIFEPERVKSAPPVDRPLKINLELALYRAKVLTKNFQFDGAQEILLKCTTYWPEDGRVYVGLGKIFIKQTKYAEARMVYERGCQATQGENAFIWQCWAVLESKTGNIRKARELFDAATVANKKHLAAWHGWAVMEIKEGNISKARNLLTKAIKFGGGNEYIYQTLALLEVRSKRFEQARYLFQQALNYNPKSCATWLAWAQVEIDEENSSKARQLFEVKNFLSRKQYKQVQRTGLLGTYGLYLRPIKAMLKKQGSF